MSEDSVAMELVSKDGEEGYPGEVSVRVTYSLAGRELRMEHRAVAAADTVLDLCNHTYWNLSGNSARGIHDHTLQLHCSHFIECVDLIPTGRILPVSGDMDLTSPLVLGEQ